MSGSAAVVAEGLSRRFGRTLACADISLVVPEGGIFALLGNNGAGKSTFVKMLVGLIRPSAGRARVLGRPAGAVAARRAIGYLPETFRYPDWATGAEVLRFHAALADMAPLRRRARVADALDRVGLGQAGGALVRTYSKGMQQRLGLACALLGEPPLLFLDEPTSALDPVGRRDVREILQALRAEGRTVFLNSHLLSEVELVSDAAAVIRGGRLAAAGSMADLLGARHEAEVALGPGEGMAAAVAAVQARWPLRERLADATGVRLVVALDEPGEAADLAAAVVGAGGRLLGLQARTRSLEDVFLELVRA